MVTKVLLLALLLGETPSDYLVRAPAAPPTQWRPSGRAVSDDRKSEILQRAQDLVGQQLAKGPIAEAAWVEAGVLEDATPFGGPARVDGWLVFLPSVAVRDVGTPKTWTPVSLYVVLDAPGRELRCAYVSSGDKWLVNREPDATSLEAYAAGELRWTCEDPGAATFRSTVPEVLGGIWATTGLNPAVASFIVVRPRKVAQAYPAELVDRELRSKDAAPTLRWIVEARGTLIDTRHGFPYTVLLSAVEDSDVTRGLWTTRP